MNLQTILNLKKTRQNLDSPVFRELHKVDLDLQRGLGKLERIAQNDNVYAILGIRHKFLVPSEITTLLELEPSSTIFKGEPSIFGGAAKSGGWFLSSEGRIASKVVDDHVRWLLDQTSGRTPAIRMLQAEGCSFEVRCNFRSANHAFGVHIIPENLERLSRLGAVFYMGFHIVEE